MALICICGLDRTGKSSVASFYEGKGFQVVHLSAPDKKFTQPGYEGPSYLEEYVDMLMSFHGKDIVMDRFWDGELVWPQVYGRQSLLSEEDISTIREIESSLDVSYVMMTDPDVENHWKRCVANNEPLTKAQFVKAKSLYSSIAEKYGFVKKTLKDFPEIWQMIQTAAPKEKTVEAPQKEIKLTKEQLKLETANAINDILSKRIVKQKGQIYDQIEVNLRSFLNSELGKIFGTKVENAVEHQFNSEEVELLRFFCKKLKEKQ